MNRYKAVVQPIYSLSEHPGKGERAFPINTVAIERPSKLFACPARGPGEWALNELVSWAGDNQSSIAVCYLDPNGHFTEETVYTARFGGL